MSLHPGTRLGPYEVLALIGAGGMGEVYRARDAKLNRDVAIKVLPDPVATDPERLARFHREAQVLASLNHPNIAHIHGYEEATGVHALVMELVEGSTLADRIAQGAIPLNEALPIAKQIAEALEAAHEQGIIHRDLKPANVKVREDGTVKVLDFGLAKLVDPTTSTTNANITASPTITSPAMMTGVGVILGTAAYMSPEQAKGRPADRRSDLWAFGCVLFEMLTARRAFEGEDVADVLVSVLSKEPDWSRLPTETPGSVRRVVRRCLQRDRKHRLDSAAAVRLELDDMTTPAQQPAAARWSSAPVAWAVAAMAGLVAIVTLAIVATPQVPIERQRISFEIPTGVMTGTTAPTQIAVSPDGRNIVTRVTDAGVSRLMLRPIESVSGSILANTDGGAYPFWSPGGNSIGFFAGGKLKVLDLVGGTPRSLADTLNGRGGSWNRNGVIVFASTADGPIYRIAAGGGTPQPVTTLDVARSERSHSFPQFLPDGDHFLFLTKGPISADDAIYVGSLSAAQPPRRLVTSQVRADFSPPDLLLYLRDTTLLAQKIDMSNFALIGDAVPIVTPVLSVPSNGPAGFSVSSTGVLAYRVGTDAGGRDLAWIDPTGAVKGTVGTAAMYEQLALSPDGSQLAVFRPENGGDIWIMDLGRGPSRRFTLDPGFDTMPAWSPDGRQVAFVSNRNGGVFNIYERSAGGTGSDTLLLKTAHDKRLNDWTADGKYLLYEEDDPKTKSDVWALPLSGDHQPTRVLGSPFNEGEATLSRDGHWLAYTSDESGPRQVYLQQFPSGERRWQVSLSTRANGHPRWGPDGQQLFFDSAGTLAAVDFPTATGDPNVKPSAARNLFAGLLDLPHNFAVSPTGDRFLVLSPPGAAELAVTTPITVVVNWSEELKRRVPAKN